MQDEGAVEQSSVGCSHCVLSALLAVSSTDSAGEVLLFLQTWRGRLEKEQGDDSKDLTGKGRTRKKTVSRVSGNSSPEQH